MLQRTLPLNCNCVWTLYRHESKFTLMISILIPGGDEHFVSFARRLWRTPFCPQESERGSPRFQIITPLHIYNHKSKRGDNYPGAEPCRFAWELVLRICINNPGTCYTMSFSEGLRDSKREKPLIPLMYNVANVIMIVAWSYCHRNRGYHRIIITSIAVSVIMSIISTIIIVIRLAAHKPKTQPKFNILTYNPAHGEGRSKSARTELPRESICCSEGLRDSKRDKRDGRCS